MNYFTKEWYDLMQRLGYTVGMKPIEDKDYSDEEISALYEKKLKAEIARDRRDYNTPPQFIPIDFDECELDDFCTYDMETGTLKRPQSMEEVKRSLEEEKARANKEFQDRPPFDPAETIQTFKAVYQGGLEHGYMRFPEWVKEQADIRLIALGFLPKSVFERLKAEQKSNKAKFDKINREAKKTLAKESAKIPERILSNFGFHDGSVLSLEKIGADWLMTVEEDCVPYEGETPYTRVKFTNGKITERDKNLTFESRTIEINGETQGKLQCGWLYDELYRTEHGYEAHMLLCCDDLCYLTISCDDIVIENNINI